MLRTFAFSCLGRNTQRTSLFQLSECGSFCIIKDKQCFQIFEKGLQQDDSNFIHVHSRIDLLRVRFSHTKQPQYELLCHKHCFSQTAILQISSPVSASVIRTVALRRPCGILSHVLKSIWQVKFLQFRKTLSLAASFSASEMQSAI